MDFRIHRGPATNPPQILRVDCVTKQQTHCPEHHKQLPRRQDLRPQPHSLTGYQFSVGKQFSEQPLSHAHIEHLKLSP